MKKECETESRTAVPSVACEVARWPGGAAGRLAGLGTPHFFQVGWWMKWCLFYPYSEFQKLPKREI